MKKVASGLVLAICALGLAGCKSNPKAVKAEGCYACNNPGTFCPGCMKISGYEGTVHCEKCGRDVAAGHWCAECNRFMIAGTTHCKKCDMDVPTGTYCPKCKKYVGVKNVSYCEKCQKPYSTKEGCPVCSKG